MGCAGRVANGINTVHLSYVRERTGHALIGARQWIPAEHIDRPGALGRDGAAARAGVPHQGTAGHRHLHRGVRRRRRPSTSSAATRCTATAPSCGSSSSSTGRPMCCGSPPPSCSRWPRRPADLHAGRHPAAARTSVGGRSARPAPARRDNAGMPGRGSPPPHPGTTCWSAATYAAASWPSTTATCPRARR